MSARSPPAEKGVKSKYSLKKMKDQETGDGRFVSHSFGLSVIA